MFLYALSHKCPHPVYLPLLFVFVWLTIFLPLYFPCSFALSFITPWMFTFTQRQQPPTSNKDGFFFSSLSSLRCSSSMAWLCVYCSSVVLQAQQVWPGFGSPGREPDGFMTQVLHAWLTCQLQVSEAQSDWFSLSLSLFPGFLASSWAIDVARTAWVSQTYTEVCALTFTLMETEEKQDWGGKGDVEWGRRDGGWMKCQGTGRLSGWLTCWIVGKQTCMHAETQTHAYAQTPTRWKKPCS